MPETDKLIGTAFAGCRILAKIGQGGMGSVYTARQDAINKMVAVKILSAELAREERNIEFFLREARSAAKLEHPNIVHIYNFGQENGSYFIIMSYIEGKSLADIIAEKGPLNPDTATDIILEVLDGLRHAHSKTIIHRDIKPANILLGTDGHPKIVDFGLARSISEEKQLTMAGEMVGTAYFMSPEQGLAGKVDHRADLYAIGATYFYLLTGKYPFEGKSSIEVIHKHIGIPFPNIILLKPDFPLWISRVLEQLTRKKPEDRYQSAAQVIGEIKRLRAAENDGTAVSNERSIDLPKISEFFAAEAAATPAPPPPPEYRQPIATLVSDRLMPAQASRPADAVNSALPLGAPVSPRRETLKGKNLQLPALHNTIKTTTYFAVTFAAIGCFLLTGSAGNPEPGLAKSLISPFAANPYGAGFFFTAGLALTIWALIMKPLKLTPMRLLLSCASALTAYTAGVYVPAPETADMVSKTFLCLKVASENIASPANLPSYSLCLFLAASKFIFKPHWGAKAGSITAYLMSILFTYIYFKAGQPVPPDKIYLILAGTAALAGLAAALTQKQFTILSSPALFFLAANALISIMFTNPHISAITENMVNRDAIRVQNLRHQSYLKYRKDLLTQEASMPEFDIEGRPIEKPPIAKPAEIAPAPREELSRIAGLEYSDMRAIRIKNAIFNTVGLLFLAVFLLLMTNIYFMEETLAYYAGHNSDSK
ncbi:MAG: serine/threonine-protein kinase [Elusimicrobiota bacterium]